MCSYEQQRQGNTGKIMNGPGTTRGSDDADLKAAQARAIQRAISGLDGGQSEVSRRTGITQPEVSKLTRASRPSPLNIWEMRAIETACGRPPGFILQEMGWLPRERSAREAIMSDPDLDAPSRQMLVAAYDAASGRTPPKKAPTKKAPAKKR